MTDLLLLVERVEGASGPDAELDARIWCALNGKRYSDHWVSGHLKGTQVAFTEPPKRTQLVTKRAVPAVTQSLDAALTLVPEGHHWQAGNGVETEHGNRDCCYAWCSPEDTGELSFAATPALALTAACLRARHSMEGLS